MNNGIYLDYIIRYLSILQITVIEKSKINILDTNLYAEDFYRDLFNLVYGLNLENANSLKQNAPSIDLIDNANKTIIQVTSTVTKDKIENTLSKSIFEREYFNYTLYFIFIGKSAENLIGKKYKNPYKIKFDSNNNIYDISRIIKKIKSLDIDNLRRVYELVKKYFEKPEISPKRVNELLPKVIKAILCYDDQEYLKMKDNIDPFEISEKINFNNLRESKYVIDEWILYQYCMVNIYEEFDRSGKLKSIAVLRRINKKYRELKKKFENSDDIFFEIIYSLEEEMRYNEELVEAGITEEELDMCIEIITVDAFIRCKIFEKPGGANNDFIKQFKS